MTISLKEKYDLKIKLGKAVYFIVNNFLIIGGSKTHIHIFIATNLTLIIPQILAFNYVFPIMFEKGYDFHIYLAMALIWLSIILHLSCFFKDPGIIPKNIKFNDQSNDNLSLNSINTSFNNNNSILNNQQTDVNPLFSNTIFTDKKRESISQDLNSTKLTLKDNKDFIDLSSSEYDPVFDTTVETNNLDKIDFYETSPKINNNSIMTTDFGSNIRPFIDELPEEKIKRLKKNPPPIYTDRYCSTCNIMKAPTVSHCPFCNNCIEYFDHHCRFTSNCVGARTFKNFYLFIIVTATALTYTIILLLFNLYEMVSCSEQLKSNLKLEWLLLTICILLIIIGLILGIILKLEALSVLIFLGNVGVIWIFNNCIPEDVDKNKINLCAFFIIAIIQPFYMYLMTFVKKHTRLIGLGITLKQEQSILLWASEVNSNSIKLTPEDPGYKYYNIVKNYSWSVMFNNFYNFFFNRNIPKSRIHIREEED